MVYLVYMWWKLFCVHCFIWSSWFFSNCFCTTKLRCARGWMLIQVGKSRTHMQNGCSQLSLALSWLGAWGSSCDVILVWKSTTQLWFQLDLRLRRKRAGVCACEANICSKRCSVFLCLHSGSHQHQNPIQSTSLPETVFGIIMTQPMFFGLKHALCNQQHVEIVPLGGAPGTFEVWKAVPFMLSRPNFAISFGALLVLLNVYFSFGESLKSMGPKKLTIINGSLDFMGSLCHHDKLDHWNLWGKSPCHCKLTWILWGHHVTKIISLRCYDKLGSLKRIHQLREERTGQRTLHQPRLWIWRLGHPGNDQRWEDHRGPIEKKNFKTMCNSTN